MTETRNISSDDAAIFSLNSGNQGRDDDDDAGETEDPVGRGASKTSQLDMFRGYQGKDAASGSKPGRGEPRAGGFQLTPGARKCPEIGIQTPKGRRFA